MRVLVHRRKRRRSILTAHKEGERNKCSSSCSLSDEQKLCASSPDRAAGTKCLTVLTSCLHRTSSSARQKQRLSWDGKEKKSEEQTMWLILIPAHQAAFLKLFQRHEVFFGGGFDGLQDGSFFVWCDFWTFTNTYTLYIYIIHPCHSYHFKKGYKMFFFLSTFVYYRLGVTVQCHVSAGWKH